jgi:hypothetical protein
MFVLCPHCQFLVALDPASGHPPQRCPRCDEPLQPATPPAAVAASAAPVEPEPVAPTAPAAATANDAAIAAPTPTPTPTPKTKSRSRSKTAASTEATAADPAAATTPAAPAAPQPEAGAIAATDAGTIPPTAVVPASAAAPAPASDANDTSSAAIPEPAAVKPDGAEPAPASATTPSPPPPETAPEEVVPGPAELPARPLPPPSPGPAPRDKAMPSFVRVPASADRADRRRKWRKPAAISALALLLALQLLLADRAQLAASARWRPLVSTLCGALHCSVPAWREPAAFTLLHRDVRPHPTLPGVLHVSATFRNDARWPQPWPALLLTLSDVDGRNVGARAFAPREYLGGAPTRSGLASGQSATVAMDIVEPAPRIVAFTFDFH